MSTVLAPVTPADLLRMPEGVQFELVGGQLVERNMSHESSWIAGELLRRLANHCEATNAGFAFPADASYQCFPDDPGKVRRPDVSFMRMELVQRHGMPPGHSRVAPDLAVEVVSPNDLAEAVSEKVVEYISAGVRLVWVIDPVTRQVFVHHPDSRGVILSADDELHGENVVPGFRCRVGDLFQRLAGVT